MSDGGSPVVVVENPEGSGSFVIVCDHASNRIPGEFSSFGVDPALLETHIAWDPGALGVARHLSARLDAPVVWPDASRLVIDCNRSDDASSLIVVETERGPVPANRSLSQEERRRRLEHIHAPYHATIDALLKRRMDTHLPTAVVAIHSFTPVFFGKGRSWQIGVVFGDDRRLADPLIHALEAADPALTVGINQPYSPADQVYYTVERHAGPRGLPAAMIEIRNDEIGNEEGQRRWADRLARILVAVERSLAGASHAAV
jgi:predicted N-formylglutamate amidohydrolase